MGFDCSKSKFSKAVLETGVTFADIIGADQAKLKLQEVIIIARDPVVVVAIMAKMG
ncbi:putative ATP-dependent zinc metalloprotease FTSH, chloroplastic [Cocos nucifera]|uniref:Putative ATP-dependent zinc metalloprotease FTSH, chloroplastic n=1 Tax=Cocos nucifera TaxID=13894 RepID=A0A8K0HUM7_COCNU|nr:putative ATP-dependent zinc metalloprotease FTSH, chloroplastic [Cocos nucifera]